MLDWCFNFAIRPVLLGLFGASGAVGVLLTSCGTAMCCEELHLSERGEESDFRFAAISAHILAKSFS